VLGIFLDTYTKASIVASAILTLPNFVANRHFVWRVESRDNMRTQPWCSGSPPCSASPRRPC
jgi:hypothetical protein